MNNLNNVKIVGGLMATLAVYCAYKIGYNHGHANRGLDTYPNEAVIERAADLTRQIAGAAIAEAASSVQESTRRLIAGAAISVQAKAEDAYGIVVTQGPSTKAVVHATMNVPQQAVNTLTGVTTSLHDALSAFFYGSRVQNDGTPSRTSASEGDS